MSEISFSNAMLDRYKSLHGLTTEYQLAKNLGVSHRTLRNWRTERCEMDWEMAFKMADELHIDGQIVLVHLLPHKIKNERFNNELSRILPPQKYVINI